MALLLLSTASAPADEFVLKTGAKIRGQWLNHEEREPQTYVVATEHGGQVSLRRIQVVAVRRHSPAEQQYELGAPRVADTVAEQWKLAAWCRARGLDQQAEAHLRRVVELDPDHAPARRALGYSELDGEWIRRADYLTQRGYVRYQGEWHLPQAVALLEARTAEEVARQEWRAKIQLWLTQLGGEKSAEALRQLQAVRDPLALDALGRGLLTERSHHVRQLLLETLAQIPGEATTAALVHLALHHNDDEVFHTCVDRLAARHNPNVVRSFAQALKDGNNARVNRAANALGRLQDPSVVTPLIDALVTVHRIVIPGNDTITSSFSSTPGVGPQISGCTGAQEMIYSVQNQEVLKALVELTGCSFGFDQQTWRDWHSLALRQTRATSSTTLRGE